jgi:hypothetical protein
VRPFIFRLVAVPSGQTIGPRGKKKRIPHTEKEEEKKPTRVRGGKAARLFIYFQI